MGHDLVDMGAYDITYVYTDEDDWTETRKIRVSAANEASAKELFLDSVRGGDEDVWGETWGATPELAGGDEWYVTGLPESSGWTADIPTKMIRFVKAEPVHRQNNPQKNVSAAKRRAMRG
jgi:hypothetical protein